MSTLSVRAFDGDVALGSLSTRYFPVDATLTPAARSLNILPNLFISAGRQAGC